MRASGAPVPLAAEVCRRREDGVDEEDDDGAPAGGRGVPMIVAGCAVEETAKEIVPRHDQAIAGMRTARAG